MVYKHIGLTAAGNVLVELSSHVWPLVKRAIELIKDAQANGVSAPAAEEPRPVRQVRRPARVVRAKPVVAAKDCKIAGKDCKNWEAIHKAIHAASAPITTEQLAKVPELANRGLDKLKIGSAIQTYKKKMRIEVMNGKTKPFTWWPIGKPIPASSPEEAAEPPMARERAAGE